MPEYLERAREYQPWEPPPTPPTGWPDWTPGFKWPWETPAGQGFQAPWTNINPLAPMQTMEPGLDYGPYADPGQIPPELLEQYDWETFDQSYIDENGKTVKVTMYRLIPKAEMTPYQQWQVSQAGLPGQAGMTEEERRYLELAEEKARRGYEQTLWERAQAGDPQAMSEWQQWQTQFLPWQAEQEYGLQQQQLELERQQQLANLAAHPINWLQYEALKGQPPVVQPFMLPLMSQQYPELADLQVGQPIPGWQTGGQTTPTGGYQPFQPTGQPAGGGFVGPGGQPPTPGLGEMLQSGQMAMPDLNQLMSKYQGMGLSQQEAEQEALHELAYLRWRSIPSGQGTQEKRISFLEMGQIAAERPETQQRYQQAIEAAQSGQPLLGGLSSKEKLALVTQLIQQGMDRTSANRQVFGGGMFGKYTPIEDISGRTPTPTTPRREPTKEREPIPESRWVGERPEIPAQKKEPKKPPVFDRYQSGTSYVPRDMTARIHRGEAIIPANENPWGQRTQGTNIRERFNREPRRTLGAEPVQPWPDNIPRPQQRLWGAEPPQPLYDPTTFKQRIQPDGFGVEPPRPLYDPNTFSQRITPFYQKQPSEWIGPPPSQRILPIGGEGGGTVPPPVGQRVIPPGYPPDLWEGGMPGLLNPSAQLWSRMGPTAQQMYLGYQQAATGIRPEEQAWRLQSMAPPAGRHPGLSYAR